MRTTVVGSWPPAARLRPALQRYHRGTLGPEAAEPLLREAASTAIAQQRACGLDQITGGETAADTFILHLPRTLSGVVPSDNTQAWDGRGTFRIVGPLDAPNGLGFAAAFRRERAIDPRLEKVTLPGPSEITMLLEPPEAARASWPRVVELIRCEIADLVASGARDIQLDAPHIAMGLADGGWTTEQAVETIAAIFADLDRPGPGGPRVRRSLHLCYGDFGARTWARNRALAPLVPTLRRLGGVVVDRLVLELSLPEQWAERERLAELDPRLELAAGIVDVKRPHVQPPDALVPQIEALLRIVPAERLLVCPSCGLGRRPVELAIDKTTAMVAAARRV